MTYSEALTFLDSAGVFGIQLGLGRIKRLLDILGNPQDSYKTVHVTGTNGKGSVTAMIASSLCQAGFKTGRYTSPHLESYTERIHVDDKDISEEDFADAMAVVKDAVEKWSRKDQNDRHSLKCLRLRHSGILRLFTLNMLSSKSALVDFSIRQTLLRQSFRLSRMLPWITWPIAAIR